MVTTQISSSTQVIPAEQALLSARQNKARQWNVGPNSARAHLASGERMAVTHRPKFAIPADASIFTIGSCFAR